MVTYIIIILLFCFSAEPRERRKLVLAPRTKPMENVPVKESVPSAAIFGNAKPVDTTQREKEIEEKLAKEHSDTRSDSKERQRHHSPEKKRSVSLKPMLFKIIFKKYVCSSLKEIDLVGEMMVVL